MFKTRRTNWTPRVSFGLLLALVVNGSAGASIQCSQLPPPACARDGTCEIIPVEAFRGEQADYSLLSSRPLHAAQHIAIKTSDPRLYSIDKLLRDSFSAELKTGGYLSFGIPPIDPPCQIYAAKGRFPKGVFIGSANPSPHLQVLRTLEGRRRVALVQLSPADDRFYGIWAGANDTLVATFKLRKIRAGREGQIRNLRIFGTSRTAWRYISVTEGLHTRPVIRLASDAKVGELMHFAAYNESP